MAMQVGIDYGLAHLDVEVAADRPVVVERGPRPPRLADPVTAVRDVLERPSGFPALRQALTPDDHVVILLDEHLPHFPELIAPVLEHIVSAGVSPEAVTLLCPPGTLPLGELSTAFPRTRVEVHDPHDRNRLSYLATTRRGRRIYLNRSAVDADQLVVFSRRGYDPLLGYAGSEGAIYPMMSDAATRQQVFEHLTLAAPGPKPWPVRKEAAEVAWLLGTPFMIQLIEGPGDELGHVVAGLADTGEEGRRLLDTSWRVTVPSMPDLVVASVSGDPGRHTFADLARALAAAARVVKPEGKIVLLTQADPEAGDGVELLREAEDAEQALELLRGKLPADMAAAFQWASAARHATIYLLSKLPAEKAEELFTIPLDQAGQVQRLLNAAQAPLFLADAHKTLAVVRNTVAEPMPESN
jgi:nickel-dependent lactate racemase